MREKCHLHTAKFLPMEHLVNFRAFELFYYEEKIVQHFRPSLSLAFENASKWCNANGSWNSFANYSLCTDIKKTTQDLSEPGIEITTMIYSVGYTLSLIALIIAVWIFVYFKDLRCLRNKIHTNLMCTYILADFMWILTMTVQMSVQSNFACVILYIFLHYCHLTNFFWMFVEGLYLYMLVVETFTRENIKLRVYFLIGWGAPLVIVTVWAIAKTFAPSSDIQGFTVALFYCFLNTEVQNTLRHHLERWKEARNLGAGGRRYTCSRDWSPNTRTESIRLDDEWA
ncbi:hypothetical protein M8J77_008950 [Diaphorina citri]|nr:hypothetical protein M8J77_008950 [Diaphorina citri]